MQIISHYLDLDEVQVLENLLSRSSDLQPRSKICKQRRSGPELQGPFSYQKYPKKRKNTRLVTTHEELQQYHSDLENSAADIEEKVIGVFSEGQMQFEVDRERENPEQPHLANMTEVAIKRLSQAENGFYLFVEGGRIDQAHHDATPIRGTQNFIYSKF